jgi:hypothetical protein
VYLPNTGGWFSLELAICINCGELFVIDRDNPSLSNRKLEDIGKQKVCLTCQSILEVTLRSYPSNFLTESGRIANFSEPTFIPDDQDTKIIEVWELS